MLILRTQNYTRTEIKSLLSSLVPLETELLMSDGSHLQVTQNFTINWPNILKINHCYKMASQ